MAVDRRTHRTCAIYTRKSSEGGSEPEFNSLDAQREAREAFVLSQRHEGWQVFERRYDDGGFSGGNIERPGLNRLLDELRRRRIDVVVVYKVEAETVGFIFRLHAEYRCVRRLKATLDRRRT